MAAPANDRFLRSVGQHIAGAVGIVVLMAAAFWGIGAAGSGDGGGDLVSADGTSSPTASDPATDPATPTDGAPTGTPTGPATTGDGTSSPTPTDSATPTDEEPPTEGGATSIPPGEISIQVLDAVRLDGSTAADEIADQLEADGYDVVVVNDASKVYDVTTVFYTAGFEASARQIAAAYGFAKVEQKPDNLSDTVRVHLVVGRDRA